MLVIPVVSAPNSSCGEARSRSTFSCVSLKATRLQVMLDVAGGTNTNLWCEPGGPGEDL